MPDTEQLALAGEVKKSFFNAITGNDITYVNRIIADHSIYIQIGSLYRALETSIDPKIVAHKIKAAEITAAEKIALNVNKAKTTAATKTAAEIIARKVKNAKKIAAMITATLLINQKTDDAVGFIEANKQWQKPTKETQEFIGAVSDAIKTWHTASPTKINALTKALKTRLDEELKPSASQEPKKAVQAPSADNKNRQSVTSCAYATRITAQKKAKRSHIKELTMRAKTISPGAIKNAERNRPSAPTKS